MEKVELKLEGKDKTYWAILDSAILLDIQLGHLKWTYSQLSRKSKQTRSLIYYYFGKSKIGILQEACKLFGEFLSGTSELHLKFWEEKKYLEATLVTRNILEKSPSLLPFYFLYRGKENEIGELIREYERRGIQKRKKFLPNLTTAQARALFALQMGISTCPEMKTKDIEEALKIIYRE